MYTLHVRAGRPRDLPFTSSTDETITRELSSTLSRAVHHSSPFPHHPLPQDTSSPLADLACMLMSNLTKLDSVCRACLEIDATKNGVKSLERLVEVFAKEGASKKANYDYLGHVFANLSAVNVSVVGRRALLFVAVCLSTIFTKYT